MEVLQQFASDMSNEEKRYLWKGCVTSIAQRCKRARNPQRKRPSVRIRRKDDDSEGLPSMAVGNDLQFDEHEDSHADSDEDYDECDDMDALDQPSSGHTLTTVQISSDSEQEEPQNGAQDVLSGSDRNKTQGTRVQSESTAHSREGGQDDDIHVPPGIDPDITVVHLPSAVKMLSKQADQGSNTGQLQRSSVASSGSESSPVARPEGIDNLGAYTVRVQETYEHEKDGASPEKNVALAHKYQGDFPPVVGSIHRPGPASAESVIVSGIKMTPDCKYMYKATP